MCQVVRSDSLGLSRLAVRPDFFFVTSRLDFKRHEVTPLFQWNKYIV